MIRRLALPTFDPDPATGTAPAASTPSTLTLTQDELDRLIDAAVGKYKSIAERAAPAVSSKDAAELEALRKDKAERARKDLEAKGEYDRVLRSKDEEFGSERSTWQKERDALLTEIKADRCKGAVVAAAGKLNAINPEQVYRLLSDEIVLDPDRKVIVLGEDGKARLKAGHFVTVEDHVRDYLAQNAHLVRASVTTGGSGATGGSQTTGTSVDAPDIAAARAVMEDARKRAEQSQSLNDVTEFAIAQKKYNALKAQAKTA